MADHKTRGFEAFLVVAAAAATLLAILSPTAVLAVPRACCFADGSCQQISGADCAAAGGANQGIGADCSAIVCPVLCTASTAPACGGECPAGQACVAMTTIAAALLPPSCDCVPEIAQGASCVLEPQACAGDLPCEDGVCCNRVCGFGERCDLEGSEGVCKSLVASPPLSSTGLILLVAILLGHQSVRLMRRRRLGGGI